MATKSKRKRAGRSPFRPTPALRRKVSILCAGGMSQDTVALALGIDRNTLSKHFEFELTKGAAAKRSQVLMALYGAATGAKPNVTAQKAFLARNETSDVSEDLRPSEPIKEPKIGKKEAAAREAQVAGINSEWGDDLGLPPRPN